MGKDFWKGFKDGEESAKESDKGLIEAMEEGVVDVLDSAIMSKEYNQGKEAGKENH